MIKYCAVIFLLFLIGCTPKSIVKTDVEKENILEVMPPNVELNHKQIDNTIHFDVINNSTESVFVHDYLSLHIEKFKVDHWELLSILTCACGVPCAKPAEYIEIPSGKKFNLSWNMEESWCGNRSASIVPETVTMKVNTGLYRIRIAYSYDGREIQMIFKEFVIN
jgi:hypothetical protein